MKLWCVCVGVCVCVCVIKIIQSYLHDYLCVCVNM